MKKFGIIFLVAVHLLAYTELHELSKMSTLVEHYTEHLSNDRQLSFFDFLRIHYLTSETGAHHHHDESKLPFKCHDFSGHPSVVSLIPPSISGLLHVPVFYIKSLNCTNYQPSLFSSFFADIWQPPQLG